ncbi:hypothetical protein CGRA01v4_09901 [Colletotrichum graminicola]|nr:hypothetical protein CGRA01v4_09901 [Colletotrichum graminicola]
MLTIEVVLLIYFFSFVFVFGTSILQFGYGADLNFHTCSAATFFCLAGYVSTKKFIYLFMVERAHIIRQTRKSRFKSKLYLINSLGMLGKAAIELNLFCCSRITHFEDGICIIGMQTPVILPLISFDAAVNVYLTILFLLPLTLDWRNRRIPRAPPNVRLRKLVIRTFIGSCCTLLSSVTNLTVLMTLNGEVAWLCLLCCNTDISFSALVINWITSSGQEATLRTLTRPSHGVSTLSPDEAASIPLDPDGNSISTTAKRWGQRRTKTPTTTGISSVDRRECDTEQGSDAVEDAREDTYEPGIEHSETQNQENHSKNTR